MSRQQQPRPSRLRRLRSAIVRQVRRPWAWWASLQPPERVFWRAIVSLSIGCGLIWPPLAFVVPGFLWTLAFFGFDMRRSR